jgi:hypothetical protein
MSDLLRVTVANGKYTVVLPEGGGLHALRYGEAWRNCMGDGLILALAQEVEALRAKNVKLTEALQWMVDNDDTNTGDVPLGDIGGRTWNEVNAYWIDGLNRARSALGMEEV